MPLTVADVLTFEVVRRGAPRVLAASDRLDAPVRWVHVIELAQARHLLRGGELVMTTGIALPPDPAGLERYVAGLAFAGASALAVELGSRYTRELPAALVAAATAHRLPLIVLERETQFIAVTEAVHERLLAGQVAELRAARQLHEVFNGLAVAGASAEDIVARASAFAGRPVILEDLAHRVLACAAGSVPLADLLGGFAARSRAVRLAGYDEPSGWLVTDVGGWGRLMLVLARPPEPADEALAAQAATTLQLAQLVTGRSALPEAHSSLLAALAGQGSAVPADLRARLAAAGLPVAGHRLLPVVVTGPADPGRIIAACAAEGWRAIAAPLGDQRVAALIALPPGADADAAARRAASGFRAGVGPAVAAVEDVRAALAEARDAAGAAQPGQVARLADLRLAGLLYQLRDDPRLLAFTERELAALLDREDDLLRVLTIYLEAGGNKAEAAKRAGLARPTLYERIRQIEQVLGVSLEESRSRLALHVALTARAAQDG